MGKIRSRELKKKLPEPKKVWAYISALAKSAYYYELHYKGEGAAVEAEDEGRTFTRIRLLVELENQAPPGNRPGNRNLAHEIVLADQVAKLFQRFAIQKLSRTEQEGVLAQELPGPFRKYAKKLTVDLQDVSRDKHGKKMGPRALANKKIGELFGLGGARSTEKHLKSATTRIQEPFTLSREEASEKWKKFEALNFRLEGEILSRLDVKSDLQKACLALPMRASPQTVEGPSAKRKSKGQ